MIQSLLGYFSIGIVGLSMSVGYWFFVQYRNMKADLFRRKLDDELQAAKSANDSLSLDELVDKANHRPKPGSRQDH